MKKVKIHCQLDTIRNLQVKYIAKHEGMFIKDIIEGLILNEYKCNYQNLKYEKCEYQVEMSNSFMLSEDTYNMLELISKKINKTFTYVINLLVYKYLLNIKDISEDYYNNSLEFAYDSIKTLKRGNSNKNEYKNFQYKEKETDLINCTKLTSEDDEFIEKLKLKYKGRKYEPILKNIYIFWKNNYSPKDISNVYNKDSRTFQLFFKENGLNRNRFEAQAIAKDKRDYKQIQLKSRETFIKNQTMSNGSIQEQYMRDILNCKLPLILNNSEVIVGVNSKGILEGGREVDIPIIVINDNITYKFAIEYNGSFWHEGKEIDDYVKIQTLSNKGYKVYTFLHEKQRTQKQIMNDIDIFTDEVCESIKTIIINNIKRI